MRRASPPREKLLVYANDRRPSAHPLDNITGDDEMRERLKRAMHERSSAEMDYTILQNEVTARDEDDEPEDYDVYEIDQYYRSLEEARRRVAEEFGDFRVPARAPEPFEHAAGPSVYSRERLARLWAARDAYRTLEIRLTTQEKG